MDTLHRATSLNNAGVQLLEMNVISGAISVFCDAVNVMKEDNMVDKNIIKRATTLTDQNPISVVHGGAYAEDLMNTIQSTNTIHSSKLPAVTLLRKMEHYVYSRPLLLPNTTVTMSLSASNSVDLDMLTTTSVTIIVFNFALSCHLHSEYSGTASTLKQALQLYNLLIRMIQQAERKPKFLQVMEYLALNNMASIYYYNFCDYKNSQHCLDCIRSLLQKHCNIDALALEFLCEAEWTDLKLNIMVIQFPLAAQAA
jgi:hypothetical protein